MALAKEELARRLRRARGLAGLTQQQVADNANVPWRSYQRWETGDYTPRPKQIPVLAQVLGVPVEHLLEPQTENVLERVERKVDENGQMLRSLLGLIDEIGARGVAISGLLEHTSGRLDALETSNGLLKDQVEFLRALGAPVPEDDAARSTDTESKKTRRPRRAAE